MGGKNSPESINRYMAKAYDRITILVPKGHKEEIKAIAQSHGESVNGYINTAIAQRMERDGSSLAGGKTPPPGDSTTVRPQR